MSLSRIIVKNDPLIYKEKVLYTNKMTLLNDKLGFKLGFNSKIPIINVSWKDLKNWDKKKNNDFNKFNFAILTGNKIFLKSTSKYYYHFNNITIVDIDFTKDEYIDKNHKFVSDFGRDYINKFDTLTIKTPNNGYHLIFNYEEDLKSRRLF